MNSNIISNLTTETYNSKNVKANSLPSNTASKSTEGDTSFKDALSKREGENDSKESRLDVNASNTVNQTLIEELPIIGQVVAQTNTDTLEKSENGRHFVSSNEPTKSISVPIQTSSVQTIIDNDDGREKNSTSERSHLSSNPHNEAETPAINFRSGVVGGDVKPSNTIKSSISANNSVMDVKSEATIKTLNESTESNTQTSDSTRKTINNQLPNVASNQASLDVTDEKPTTNKVYNEKSLQVEQTSNLLSNRSTGDEFITLQGVETQGTPQRDFHFTSRHYFLSNMVSRSGQDIAREAHDVKDGEKREIKVTIRPNHLGELKIEISKEAGKTNVSIITSNESVTNYLNLHKGEILSEAEKTLRSMDSNTSGGGGSKQGDNKENDQPIHSHNESPNDESARLGENHLTNIILNITGSQE